MRACGRRHPAFVSPTRARRRPLEKVAQKGATTLARSRPAGDRLPDALGALWGPFAARFGAAARGVGPAETPAQTRPLALSDAAIESVHATFDSSGRLHYGPDRFEALEL
jgi:hypothetical protein